MDKTIFRDDCCPKNVCASKDAYFPIELTKKEKWVAIINNVKSVAVQDKGVKAVILGGPNNSSMKELYAAGQPPVIDDLILCQSYGMMHEWLKKRYTDVNLPDLILADITLPDLSFEDLNEVFHKVYMANTDVDLPNLTLEDFHKVFKPSQELMDLVERHMVHPDSERLAVLDELMKMTPESELEELDISDFISKAVEALLTSLAQHSFITEQPVRISINDRFTPEICEELNERLVLDAHNPRPVLDRLYMELFRFASKVPNERSWGRIEAENSELKLIVKRDAFKFPRIDDIEEDRWITTE